MNTRINYRLASLLRQLPTPRLIYDLGCGGLDDAFIYRALWPAAQIVGLDRDRDALRRAQRRDPSLPLVEAELTALPLLPRADLILIRHPDVDRHPDEWAHLFASLPALLLSDANVLITTYTAPEFDRVRRWLADRLLPLSINAATLEAVGLDGRDRYNGYFKSRGI